MKRRGWAVLVGMIALGLGLGWWNFRRGYEAAPVGATGLERRLDPPPPRSSPPPPLTPDQRRKILLDAPEARLADDLNLPGSDIRRDLGIVASLFAAWRSNYPGQGNPFGHNREITEKLLGRNPNGIIFLRAENRGINAEGELCDRWGTPFFFHAESGTKMEIRSAGPDRRLWTADDEIVNP